jgi:hypothetical protein
MADIVGVALKTWWVFFIALGLRSETRESHRGSHLLLEAYDEKALRIQLSPPGCWCRRPLRLYVGSRG